MRQRLVPLRSRIIATEDLGEERVRDLVPGLKMLTDTRAMTYYFRPSPDGRRILFGGRDVTSRGDPDSATQRNYAEMCRVFPQLEGVGISHSWFGYVAMNRDMVPRIFQRGAVHYATGFCGSGVVWAPGSASKQRRKYWVYRTARAVSIFVPTSCSYVARKSLVHAAGFRRP